VVADGGPAVLLDHPHLDRTTELAMVALGGRLPECVLVLDAIAGRASPRRILWRRRPYAIAVRSFDRRYCRRLRRATLALELPLAERYATFVQHRAVLWFRTLLPASAYFDIRVVRPRAVPAPVRPSTVWSWRQRPGISAPGERYRTLTIHIPFDWHQSVEQANSTALLTRFVVQARTDRTGTMLQSLYGEVQKLPWNREYIDWTTRIEAVDSEAPVPPRRWYRARKASSVRLPTTSSGGHDQ